MCEFEDDDFEGFIFLLCAVYFGCFVTAFGFITSLALQVDEYWDAVKEWKYYLDKGFESRTFQFNDQQLKENFKYLITNFEQLHSSKNDVINNTYMTMYCYIVLAAFPIFAFCAFLLVDGDEFWVMPIGIVFLCTAIIVPIFMTIGYSAWTNVKYYAAPDKLKNIA